MTRAVNKYPAAVLQLQITYLPVNFPRNVSSSVSSIVSSTDAMAFLKKFEIAR